MARLWRVYHPTLPETAGAITELEAAESHHVARVLRLRPGDALAVFDGRGGEWRARIVEGSGGHVLLRLEEPVAGAVEPGLAVTLFQGLCRPERMDWIVQKATEIGVAALEVVATSRAEPASAERRLERWRRIALEACKQCGRRRFPLLEARAALPGSATEGPAALLLDTGSDAPPLAEALEAAGEDVVARGVWLAVGPEGGFTAPEVAAALEAGWRRAGLGPRTLRAETAGIVAAAIVLHLHGDLGASRATPAAR
jgi:16S rRNA (uracil1498-N3)-methyltransferase